MRRPQFIYFDLGNVLLHFDHPRSARQMAEVAGASFEQVWEAVFAGDTQARYERGDIACDQFHAEFSQRTNTTSDLAALKYAAAAIFTPNEPVMELVRHLHGAGVSLGILSNTCAAHWEYCLDGRYPVLNDCFTHYALSFELKSMKPDAAIYERAAALAGVAPEMIFFIDDRPDNVAGALAAGYDAVVYESPEQLHGALQQRGVL